MRPLLRRLLGPVEFETSPPDGSLRVGLKEDFIPADGRRMRVLTWYPAAPTCTDRGHLYESGVRGAARPDAQPDRSDAPYPLIVFSQGLMSAADGSVFYTENLASHGFVVMSVDHRDANDRRLPFRDGGWKYPLRFFPRMLGALLNRNSSDTVLILNTRHFRETEFGLNYRPREVSLALEFAGSLTGKPGSTLEGMIDLDSVGMTGHSLGGFISLLLGGMTLVPGGPNIAMLDTYEGCLADVDACRSRFAKALGDPAGLRDDRIKAVLAMAPPIFHGDIATNASAIRTPLMFLVGDSARWEATLDKIVTVYANARGPRHLVLIRDTDHFVIWDHLMSIPLGRYIPLPLFRARFFEKAQVYKDYSAAFFNLYLKGKKDEGGILDRPNSPYVKDIWRQPST